MVTRRTTFTTTWGDPLFHWSEGILRQMSRSASTRTWKSMTLPQTPGGSLSPHPSANLFSSRLPAPFPCLSPPPSTSSPDTSISPLWVTSARPGSILRHMRRTAWMRWRRPSAPPPMPSPPVRPPAVLNTNWQNSFLRTWQRSSHPFPPEWAAPHFLTRAIIYQADEEEQFQPWWIVMRPIFQNLHPETSCDNFLGLTDFHSVYLQTLLFYSGACLVFFLKNRI